METVRSHLGNHHGNKKH